MTASVLTDLHTHTISSGHAFSTLDEMARTASEAGLHLIAITDHGPSMEGAPHSGYFSMVSRLPDVVHGVRVLMGIEANVVAIDGQLDLAPELLDAQDLVLAGLHERTPYVGAGAPGNTAALIHAIRSGHVHVVSHPFRAQLPVNVRELAKAATDTGVLLEVNVSVLGHALRTPGSSGSAQVLEQTRKMLEELERAGGRCSVSSDAHHSSDLAAFPSASQAVIAALDIPAELIANADIASLRAFGWEV